MQRPQVCMYNAAQKDNYFKVGDTVVYKLHMLCSKEKGISAKMMLTWSRPVTIASFLRPNVVQLANPNTRE